VSPRVQRLFAPLAGSEGAWGAAPSSLARRLIAPLAIVAGAALLRILTGVGFANYDTLYALVWGQQLAGGHTPGYAIPVAPTPHPLVEALGFALAPLGSAGMERITVALGFVALAGCGWVLHRLGALWFGRLAGALAAILFLTRVPVLSYGARAYVDLPYLLLVLGAVLIALPRPERPGGDGGESPARRRRESESPAGRGRRGGSPTAVLALLALAGLLRPEAWAFSGLYWLYLAVAAHRAAHEHHGSVPPSSHPGSARATTALSPAQLARLALLAALAPVLWMLSDLLITGDLLWSLTNTRHTAQELARETGLAKVPEYIPRRIGEILRPSVLAGAALGGVLALLWLRQRALAGALAGVIAVAVFAAFAAAGLPINTRYAFLASAILCVFCGAAVFGWTQLAVGDRRRAWWMAGGALVAIALVASAPGQYRAADRELSNLRRQQSIQNELLALVDRRAISLRCGPVGVPNHRPIPLLALRLNASPADVVSAQAHTIARGVYVAPATAAVAEDYILDPHDTDLLIAHVPAGFTPTGGNGDWRVYQRCP
jgi:hypothetical protein